MKSSNKIIPNTLKFHSTPHLYKGENEPDLLLEIYEYGNDSLEIKLINRNLPMEKKNIRKHISLFILSSVCYMCLHIQKIFQMAHVEFILLMWFGILMWRMTQLVEYEKFIFCYDFGLHLQTQRFLSKSSIFLVTSTIYDIRINEVIENLDFRYLLIIRTKGKLFRTNPIVPVFKVLKPSCDCLSLIYHRLNKVLIRAPTPSQ